MPHALVKEYTELVKAGEITADTDQKALVQKLAALAAALVVEEDASFFKRVFKGVDVSGGLYIYGGVGRGKTMLMDLFFNHTNITKKRRVHFHSFMLEIHAKINAWKKEHPKEENPLKYIAQDIVKETSLLCFDEFQVHDIADAMILERLFRALFKAGVVVIATSNRAPEALYEGGLQRERFVPFIELLGEQLEVMHMGGKVDYRYEHFKNLNTVYFTPLGKKADGFLKESFGELVMQQKPRARTLIVQGRKMQIEKATDDVALFSFAQLCEQPLGAADYIEIARQFNTVVIADIPKLSKDKRNEAKRFVTLIDALYEHKTKLVCTAAAPPEALYTEGTGAFEFERTVSRLVEMQTESYLHEQHLG
jgi:cell division protein ZapE